MTEPTNEELADWLHSMKQRFVPGLTGYDWADRRKLDLIIERLTPNPTATETREGTDDAD